jgi:hypothetical protein
MVAGIERSTFPGPRVMTYICPMPTITEKVAKAKAADRISPAPCPLVNTMVAAHTSPAPRKAQIHGFSNKVLRRSAIIAGVGPPFG